MDHNSGESQEMSAEGATRNTLNLSGQRTESYGKQSLFIVFHVILKRAISSGRNYYVEYN